MAVTDADVEHVRRAFASFNDHFGAMAQEDAVAGYWNEFWAPDGVIENVDNFPAPGRYQGLAGYREFSGDSYGSYRDISWRIVSIDKAGDRVVALVRVSGKPADDDVELEVALGITYEMRDGKIAHSRVYVGHDRARDAASSGG